jgi:hypothetical protein
VKVFGHVAFSRPLRVDGFALPLDDYEISKAPLRFGAGARRVHSGRDVFVIARLDVKTQLIVQIAARVVAPKSEVASPRRRV